VAINPQDAIVSGSLEAIDAGIDIEDYLEWIDKGLPHDELLFLHAHGRMEWIEVWHEWRDSLDIQEFCEALDEDVEYLEYYNARKVMSHEEAMHVVRLPGSLDTYRLAVRHGSKRAEAEQLAMEATRVSDPMAFWPLHDKGITVDEMMDLQEGTYFYYLSHRKKGRSHHEAVKRASRR
jgi:hypothetical protein